MHPDGRAPSGDRRRRLRGAVAGRARACASPRSPPSPAAAVAFVLASRRGCRPAAAPGPIALLDARTLEPVATVDRLGAPDGVWPAPEAPSGRSTYAGPPGRAWTRARSRSPPASPLSDIEPGPPAGGAGALWVGDGDAAGGRSLRPALRDLVRRIQLPATDSRPGQPTGLAVRRGLAVGRLRQLAVPARPHRPGNEPRRSTIDLPSPDGQALLAFGGGALWVVAQDTGRIWKIDPASDPWSRPRASRDGGWCRGRALRGRQPVAARAGRRRGLAGRRRRATSVRSVPTGARPYALGADESGDRSSPTRTAGRSRASTPRTGRVRRARVGHMPNTAAVAGGRVWVALTPSAADARRGLDPAHDRADGHAGRPVVARRTRPWSSPARSVRSCIARSGARLLRYPRQAAAAHGRAAAGDRRPARPCPTAAGPTLPHAARLPLLAAVRRAGHGRGHALQHRAGAVAGQSGHRRPVAHARRPRGLRRLPQAARRRTCPASASGATSSCFTAAPAGARLPGPRLAAGLQRRPARHPGAGRTASPSPSPPPARTTSRRTSAIRRRCCGATRTITDAGQQRRRRPSSSPTTSTQNRR